MARTSIAWTDMVWNPVTGCDRISAGCDNCYALRMAKRLKKMGVPQYQRDGDPRTSGPGFAVTCHPALLGQPKHWGGHHLVFVNSMSDLFHAKVPTSFIQEVIQVIRECPQHIFQVLTKRPTKALRLAQVIDWPPNLWLGVSVENMAVARRVDELRQIPAALRFLSCEPLLGDLGGLDLSGIGWVIAGGESGPGARPVEADWVRGLRDACVANQIPFFFKQWGHPKSAGRLLDGRVWDQMPALGCPAGSRKSAMIAV